ncbi:MAG: hypothetical protein B6I37_01105 [Desulfobacteraceae bacterium 4572_35.2]|nr:MAG: hypothetical protein B6I37_01105 [Desulfobacteraceae bacterium 4572_35.2]
MRDLKKVAATQKTKVKRLNRNVRYPSSRNWKQLISRCTRGAMLIACAGLVIVGVVLLIDLVVNSEHFQVQSITVQGNYRLSDQDVIDLSDIRQGVRTFDLDLESIGEKIAENDWIRSARIMRKLPQGIIVDITEREVCYIIKLEYLYYVDRDGEIFKVLRDGDDLDYPLVTGLDRQQLLDHIDVSQQRLRQIAAMLSDLQSRELFNVASVAQIDINPQEGFVLYSDPFGVPIYVGNQHFSEKIDLLEHIYVDIEKRLPVLQYIDLNVPDKVIVK